MCSPTGLLRDQTTKPADMTEAYCRQGFNHPSQDNFTLEVLVRMSDISETAQDSRWKVKLGVSSGEVLTVATREVTVSRVWSAADRKTRERPLININLQLEDVSQSD